jgi:hypothetical protein
MYSVEIYNEVRLACHYNDMNHREAAHQFGVSRKTIRKILSNAETPRYRRIVPTHNELLCRSMFTLIRYNLLNSGCQLRPSVVFGKKFNTHFQNMNQINDLVGIA